MSANGEGRLLGEAPSPRDSPRTWIFPPGRFSTPGARIRRASRELLQSPADLSRENALLRKAQMVGASQGEERPHLVASPGALRLRPRSAAPVPLTPTQSGHVHRAAVRIAAGPLPRQLAGGKGPATSAHWGCSIADLEVTSRRRLGRPAFGRVEWHCLTGKSHCLLAVRQPWRRKKNPLRVQGVSLPVLE
jgi:hypothetical protein